jgi:hypothetical protein
MVYNKKCFWIDYKIFKYLSSFKRNTEVRKLCKSALFDCNLCWFLLSVTIAIMFLFLLFPKVYSLHVNCQNRESYSKDLSRRLGNPINRRPSERSLYFFFNLSLYLLSLSLMYPNRIIVRIDWNSLIIF